MTASSQDRTGAALSEESYLNRQSARETKCLLDVVSRRAISDTKLYKNRVEAKKALWTKTKLLNTAR